LQERLADAQTAQTSADSDAKAADVRAKHLAKQLAEAKKAAASKEAESAGLGRELAKQQAAVEAATTRLKV
jgi:structural maintenance of chromosome 2